MSKFAVITGLILLIHSVVFGADEEVVEKTIAKLNSAYKLAFSTDHLKGDNRPFFGESFHGYTEEEITEWRKHLLSVKPYEEYRASLFKDDTAAVIIEVIDPGEDTGYMSILHFPAGNPLIIDLGPGASARKSLPILLGEGLFADSKIDFFLSHPHFDHYGIFEVIFSLYEVEHLYYFDYPYFDTYRWVYLLKYALEERNALAKGSKEFFDHYEILFQKIKEINSKGGYNEAMKTYYAFVNSNEFKTEFSSLYSDFIAKAVSKVSIGDELAISTGGISLKVIWQNAKATNPNNASSIILATINTGKTITRALLNGDGEGTDTSGKRWDSKESDFNYQESTEYNVLKYLIKNNKDLFEGENHGLDLLECPHHGSRNGAFNLLFNKQYTTESDYKKILELILADLVAEQKGQGKGEKEIIAFRKERENIDLGNLVKSNRRTIVYCSTGDTSYSGTQHPYHSTIENYAPLTTFRLVEKYPEPFNLSRQGKQIAGLQKLAEDKNINKDKLLHYIWKIFNEDPTGTPLSTTLFEMNNPYEKDKIERAVDEFLTTNQLNSKQELDDYVTQLIDLFLNSAKKNIFQLAASAMKRFKNSIFPYGTEAYARQAASLFIESGCQNAGECRDKLTPAYRQLIIELVYTNAISSLVINLRTLVVSKCRFIEKDAQESIRITLTKDGSAKISGGIAPSL